MYIFFDKKTGEIIDITYPVTDPSGDFYGASLGSILGDDLFVRNYPYAIGTETNISEVDRPLPTWEEINLEIGYLYDEWLPKIGSLIELNDSDMVDAQSDLQDYYAALLESSASGVNTRGQSIETVRATDALISVSSGYEPVFSPDVTYIYRTDDPPLYEYGPKPYQENPQGSGTYKASTVHRALNEVDEVFSWMQSSASGVVISFRTDFDFDTGNGWMIVHQNDNDTFHLVHTDDYPTVNPAFYDQYSDFALASGVIDPSQATWNVGELTAI